MNYKFKNRVSKSIIDQYIHKYIRIIMQTCIFYVLFSYILFQRFISIYIKYKKNREKNSYVNEIIPDDTSAYI